MASSKASTSLGQFAICIPRIPLFPRFPALHSHSSVPDLMKLKCHVSSAPTGLLSGGTVLGICTTRKTAREAIYLKHFCVRSCDRERVLVCASVLDSLRQHISIRVPVYSVTVLTQNKQPESWAGLSPDPFIGSIPQQHCVCTAVLRKKRADVRTQPGETARRLNQEHWNVGREITRHSTHRRVNQFQRHSILTHIN